VAIVFSHGLGEKLSFVAALSGARGVPKRELDGGNPLTEAIVIHEANYSGPVQDYRQISVSAFGHRLNLLQVIAGATE